MVSKKNTDSFDKVSPLDGRVLGSYPVTSKHEAKQSVVESREVFQTWKNTTIESRGRMIRAAAKLLEERQAALAQIVREETGKPLNDSLGEIGGAIEMGYMMAAHGRFPLGKLLPSAVPLRQVRLSRVPLGVAALIVTYNAPIPNFAWKIFPALMAGNTVLVKPSPHTPGSAEAFVEILHEAGVPKDVLRVLHGDGETASGLIEGGADLVSFTGSYPTGLKVMEGAAQTLAKTVIELGGSNPLVVFADAQLEKAAATAKDSAFSNAGQRCASASRVIVENSAMAAFLEAVRASSATLVVGTSNEATIGTLIDQPSAEAFEAYLSDCEKSGARVERLGTLSGESSSVVKPALVTGLDPRTELGGREVFGPVMRVFGFEGEAEAIALANETEFGLTAAVWSSDLVKAERVVSEIQAGVININGPTHGAEVNFPFGGVKHSGNGSRDAGVEAIDAYSDVRVVSTFFGV
jgi:acyl-CoA reductase-like NAD-dependent aldehyde dehydrogenase